MSQQYIQGIYISHQRLNLFLEVFPTKKMKRDKRNRPVLLNCSTRFSKTETVTTSKLNRHSQTKRGKAHMVAAKEDTAVKE